MLPDFGWTELLLIAIVLIVVVGPKDLPRVLRGFSKTLGSARKMAGDFRKQFDDALSEAELDELKTLASDVRGMDPRSKIKDALNPLSEVGRDINDELKGVAKSVDDAAQADIEGTKAVNAQINRADTKVTENAAAEVEAPAKKASAKKAPAKKAPAKKSTVAKSTAAKKPVAKPKAATAAKSAPTKTAKRKTTAKKTAAKPSTPKGEA
ncbi:Sec-independent protein translocase protein TatB [Ahrensia marina]|uniref:Sec-independent protein translocase protein TatB n=1 Tax=Ahrensia marina TaxID=1514904 RepID=UPI0009E85099|nr:Sec-independent protein translocase protein TatB [Ahrensia marina]